MQIPPSQSQVISNRPVGQGQVADPNKVDLTSRGGRPDGAACFGAVSCLSGICEGASCDSSRPGTCVPKERPCTADLVEYCGCDGNTFLSSSSCPGEAFSNRGMCEEEDNEQ